jgi:hypothetical protein
MTFKIGQRVILKDSLLGDLPGVVTDVPEQFKDKAWAIDPEVVWCLYDDFAVSGGVPRWENLKNYVAE